VEKILELNHVTKHYDDFVLNIDHLSLNRGYIMGFIGPNGAGKSTTIKLIMNLVKKDGGEIRLFGQDHKQEELTVKERIGFVYDHFPFYEELTAEEMKNMIRPFYRRWDEPLFQRYVRDFKLPLKKQIKHLSKGMKMKLALAIAFSHHAELLIMDEPTSGLDPLIRRELLEILQSLMEDERKAVFFSTHITSDLDKVADYITLIHQGEIMFSVAKDDLLDEYCLVKGSHDILKKIDRELLVGVKTHRFGFEALSNNRRELIKQLGDAVLIEKPTLEEIMIFSITGSEQDVSSY
jgi:ABC-2 type transport system ATP-binding protein